MGYIAVTLGYANLTKTAETYSLAPRPRERKTWDWLKWVLLGGAALGGLGLMAKGRSDMVTQQAKYYRKRDLGRLGMMGGGAGLVAALLLGSGNRVAPNNPDNSLGISGTNIPVRYTGFQN